MCHHASSPQAPPLHLSADLKVQQLVVLLANLFPRRSQAGSGGSGGGAGGGTEGDTEDDGEQAAGLSDRVHPYHTSVLDWLTGNEIDAGMKVRALACGSEEVVHACSCMLIRAHHLPLLRRVANRHASSDLQHPEGIEAQCHHACLHPAARCTQRLAFVSSLMS